MKVTIAIIIAGALVGIGIASTHALEIKCALKPYEVSGYMSRECQLLSYVSN